MSASDVQASDWNSGTTAAILKPALESISWYSAFGRVPHFTDVPKSSHRMICRLGQTAALWIHVDPTLPASSGRRHDPAERLLFAAQQSFAEVDRPAGMGRQYQFIGRESGLSAAYRTAIDGHCPLLT